jgi:AAA+ ATPase superfamily predicted ATPase
VQEKTFEQWLDEVHAENKQMFEEARQRVEQEMLEEARQSILAERKASGSA